MEDTLVKRILDQCQTLDADRLQQETTWDELGLICFPRWSGISDLRNPSNKGRSDRGRIAQNWDGTAMRSCETLAKGQAARITPMGGRWFVLRPPQSIQENLAARNWYARCTEIMYSFLGASNFYNRAFEMYQQRGAFGCGAIIVTGGQSGRGLHFSTMPIGTYSIAENSMDEVDVVFRTYFRTPAQLVEQFGEENLHKTIIEKYSRAASKHANTEEIVHALMPRQDRDPRMNDDKNKPIASFHVHKASATMMRESGFDSMPVATSRWMSNPMSPYGWGPADYALPEAAQANYQEQMLDVLAENAAYPRVLVPVGMKDEVDFAAMGITMWNPNESGEKMPQEWLTGGNYQVAKDRAQDKKRAIEQAFFVDLFTAISRLSPDATATQVSAIVSESRELFHPIFSNMVREFHTPVLRRCFGLLMEQGAFPPPPPQVVEQDEIGAFIGDPDVEYVSAMALALEQSHVMGIAEMGQLLQPFAAHDPAYMDRLSPERVTEYIVRAKGFPTSILRTEEEMGAMEQQKQQMAIAQQAEMASGAVRNLGGVDETAKAAGMIQPE